MPTLCQRLEIASSRRLRFYLRHHPSEAVINMLIDIAIISLPMSLAWRLQMTKGRKIIYTMVFGLGSMYVPVLVVSF